MAPNFNPYATSRRHATGTPANPQNHAPQMFYHQALSAQPSNISPDQMCPSPQTYTYYQNNLHRDGLAQSSPPLHTVQQNGLQHNELRYHGLDSSLPTGLYHFNQQSNGLQGLGLQHNRLQYTGFLDTMSQQTVSPQFNQHRSSQPFAPQQGGLQHPALQQRIALQQAAEHNGQDRNYQHSGFHDNEYQHSLVKANGAQQGGTLRRGDQYKGEQHNETQHSISSQGGAHLTGIHSNGVHAAGSYPKGILQKGLPHTGAQQTVSPRNVASPHNFMQRRASQQSIQQDLGQQIGMHQSRGQQNEVQQNVARPNRSQHGEMYQTVSPRDISQHDIAQQRDLFLRKEPHRQAALQHVYSQQGALYQSGTSQHTSPQKVASPQNGTQESDTLQDVSPQNVSQQTISHQRTIQDNALPPGAPQQGLMNQNGFLQRIQHFHQQDLLHKGYAQSHGRSQNGRRTHGSSQSDSKYMHPYQQSVQQTASPQTKSPHTMSPEDIFPLRDHQNGRQQDVMQQYEAPVKVLTPNNLRREDIDRRDSAQELSPQRCSPQAQSTRNIRVQKSHPHHNGQDKVRQNGVQQDHAECRGINTQQSGPHHDSYPRIPLQAHQYYHPPPNSIQTSECRSTPHQSPFQNNVPQITQNPGQSMPSSGLAHKQDPHAQADSCRRRSATEVIDLTSSTKDSRPTPPLDRKDIESQLKTASNREQKPTEVAYSNTSTIVFDSIKEFRKQQHKLGQEKKKRNISEVDGSESDSQTKRVRTQDNSDDQLPRLVPTDARGQGQHVQSFPPAYASPQYPIQAQPGIPPGQPQLQAPAHIAQAPFVGVVSQSNPFATESAGAACVGQANAVLPGQNDGTQKDAVSNPTLSKSTKGNKRSIAETGDEEQPAPAKKARKQAKKKTKVSKQIEESSAPSSLKSPEAAPVVVVVEDPIEALQRHVREMVEDGKHSARIRREERGFRDFFPQGPEIHYTNDCHKCLTCWRLNKNVPGEVLKRRHKRFMGTDGN